MEFRVLGPLEVVDGDAPVEIAGAKRKALLALLVLRANEVIRTERLIDDLWGERPPRNAQAALHNHVSRLRKALGSDVLVRREWGYVLRTPPESIDLRRFEDLIAEADALPARERAAKLARALTLWRGAPLTDIALEPCLQPEVARLEEVRLSVLERRIDADLECGRTSELIGELERLIAQHPLREHLRWQLILSLYRADRQAEALEVYRETRRVLADELGLEPSPALRELEKAILRHDAALAVAAAPRPANDVSEGRVRRSALAWLVPMSLGIAATASGAVVAVALVHGDHAEPSAGSATPVVVTETTPHSPVRATPRAVHVARHARRSGRPAATSPPPGKATTGTSPEPAAPDTAAVQPESTPPSSSTQASASAKPAAHTVHGSTSAPRPKGTRTAVTKPPARPSTPTPTPTPAPTPTPPTVATITDTFDTDYVDGTIWYEICCSGTGATLREKTGELEFAFAPDTIPGGQFATAGGHVGTRCKFPGDFDARVDFALVDWPPGNGVVVSLYAFLGPTNIAVQVIRSSSAAWGEQYGGWFDQEPPGSAVLPDTTGTFRLVRKDGLLTGYFLHNGAWQSLSAHRNALPATIALGANVGPGYGGSFGGQQVVVDLDNFTVTGPDPDCPRGSQPATR